jgi:hypothetical protein
MGIGTLTTRFEEEGSEVLCRICLPETAKFVFNLLVLEGPRYFPDDQEVPAFTKPLVENCLAEWDSAQHMLFLLCGGERVTGPAKDKFCLLKV